LGLNFAADFTKKLNHYFEIIVEIPRIKVGKRQTLDTLITKRRYRSPSMTLSLQRNCVTSLAIIHGN
jgi:hypothetical protein